MNNSDNILVNNQNNVLNQNSVENIDWEGTPWRDRVFSHPERTITIGTSCSGIGAPEQALRQLGLKSEILFAGDIDRNVKKSYFANYEITEEQWHDDMFKFDATPFKGKLTLFIAGDLLSDILKSWWPRRCQRQGTRLSLQGFLSYRTGVRTEDMDNGKRGEHVELQQREVIGG